MSCLEKLLYGNGVNPLPKMITLLLFLLQVCAAVSMTIVFPFLPRLVKSFHVDEQKTGYYVGAIASALFIGRVLCSLVWGYVSDSFGKKFSILVTSCGMMSFTLMFAFSQSVWWAFISRLMQGAFMGILVISKSIMSDVCDDTNLSFGMTVLVSSFSVGLLLGPAIGGFLAFPADQYPGTVPKGSILVKYGVLLPNMTIVLLMLITSFLACCFLPKDKKTTGESAPLIVSPLERRRKRRRDLEKYRHSEYLDYNFDFTNEEQFLQQQTSESPSETSESSNTTCMKKLKDSKLGRALRTKKCVFVSCLYGLCSVTGIAFDEMFSLFAATSKTYHGFGLQPSEIGTILIISAVGMITAQILFLGKITKKLGAKKAFIGSCLMQTILLFFLPQISFIQSHTWAKVCMVLIHILIRSGITCSFITVNVMLNNSVQPDLVGTANGLGTTISSAGRAIAPSLFGSLFAWSLKNIALGFPVDQNVVFVLLATCNLLTAVIATRLPITIDQKLTRDEIKPIKLTVSTFQCEKKQPLFKCTAC